MSNELVVSIRNFQRIKKATFKFEPGLNVIVGSSNQGKSSSFRAITSALFNTARDSQITIGESACAVGLKYKDNEVIWKRDLRQASKVSYKVNGVVLTKVGRGQPEEVASALGIREVEFDDTRERLNFQKQMAYPFLLDRTPSQVFKFFAQSAEEDNLMQVLSDMKSDGNALSVQIKADLSAMDSLKVAFTKERDIYNARKHLIPVCKKVLSVDAEMNEYENMNQLVSSVESSKSSLDSVLPKIEVCQIRLDKASPLVEECASNMAVVQSLMESCSSADSLKSVYEDTTTSLGELSGKLSKVNILSDVETDVSSIETLERLVAQLEILGRELSNSQQEKASKELELSRASEALKKCEGLLDNISCLRSSVEDISQRLEGLDNLTSIIQKNQKAYKFKEDELKAVESQISEFKICPYCGSRLEDSHGECNG